jgi:Ni,Fe-hydrogenase III small subunit
MLVIRQIGDCSCSSEIEIAALTDPIYDIERFGIPFVAFS